MRRTRARVFAVNGVEALMSSSDRGRRRSGEGIWAIVSTEVWPLHGDYLSMGLSKVPARKLWGGGTLDECNTLVFNSISYWR